jgi:hypothetical protein
MPEPHDVPDLSAYAYQKGISSVPARKRIFDGAAEAKLIVLALVQIADRRTVPAH